MCKNDLESLKGNVGPNDVPSEDFQSLPSGSTLRKVFDTKRRDFEGWAFYLQK